MVTKPGSDAAVRILDREKRVQSVFGRLGRAVVILGVSAVLIFCTGVVVTLGWKSMVACEGEEGFLVGYKITRSYDALRNRIVCTRTSEKGEVKVTLIDPWELLGR